MKTYTLTRDGTMVGDGTGRFILVKSDNYHYQEVLAEVAAGQAKIVGPPPAPAWMKS